MEITTPAQRARRFRRLPVTLICDVVVPVATSPLSKLLGLAWMDPDRDGSGLLIPGCRSVHTFGMRFPIDIHFLDHQGGLIRSEMRAGPRRNFFCHEARFVLELSSDNRV